MPPIVVADIGGTNIRFASFEVRHNALHCVALGERPTAEVQNGRALIRILQDQGFLTPTASEQTLILALAGVIKNPRQARLTNASWAIDLDQLTTSIPQHTELINDFVAQAMGCTLTGQRATMIKIQPGLGSPGVMAAMGPGTGLGMCTLITNQEDQGLLALPSEGGHAPWPFISEEELALQKFMRTQTKASHIFGDMLVSGRGLTFIHYFLTGKKLTPPEVAAELTSQSPTTIWFARFLGRAGQILALHVLPRAGLFLCGGILAKNPFLATHPEFLKAFTHCPTYGELLAKIPVHLATAPYLGLWGAAQYARLARAKKQN